MMCIWQSAGWSRVTLGAPDAASTQGIAAAAAAAAAAAVVRLA